MSIGDARKVVQVQKLDNVIQVNEAFRQLNEAITKLEGRKGQILLRDGVHSTTSTQAALVLDSELSNVASMGVYFTGSNSNSGDTWIANGAYLSPTEEWVALNTHASFLKLSFGSGPQFYYNTDLTIGTSFIPTIMASPGSSTIVWASYDATTAALESTSITWNTTLHEEAGYFSKSGTNVTLLLDGIYQIHTSAALTTSDASGQTAIILNLNGSRIRDSKIATELADPINHHSLYHIDNFVAGDVISVFLNQGDLYTAESTGLNRLYITRLVSA